MRVKKARNPRDSEIEPNDSSSDVGSDIRFSAEQIQIDYDTNPEDCYYDILETFRLTSSGYVGPRSVCYVTT